MSTAKLKVTVSCGSVKEQMYFRTSFFNNGIPLRNQFPIINRVFQKLVKPGYQVRVCRAHVDYPIDGWHNLDSVFAWLPTVRLHRLSVSSSLLNLHTLSTGGRLLECLILLRSARLGLMNMVTTKDLLLSALKADMSILGPTC